MEQLLAELKKILPFKDTTVPGDIVLIATENPPTFLYGKVGEIVRDESRKAEWWHVTLHLLAVPIQTVVWTLRMPQFTGQESFTMGGEGHFVQAIQFADSPAFPPAHDTIPEKKKRQGQQNSMLRVVK